MWMCLTFSIFNFARRMLSDDSRGVGEALDETVCVGNSCEGLTVCI